MNQANKIGREYNFSLLFMIDACLTFLIDKSGKITKHILFQSSSILLWINCWQISGKVEKKAAMRDIYDYDDIHSTFTSYTSEV